MVGQLQQMKFQKGQGMAIAVLLVVSFVLTGIVMLAYDRLSESYAGFLVLFVPVFILVYYVVFREH